MNYCEVAGTGVMPIAGLLGGSPALLDLGKSRIAYWKVGSGDPLLLVHGYPLSARTWRQVVGDLAKHFTCYVVDLPGAGETRWTAGTDFSFAGQAKTLKAFTERLRLGHYYLMAHDTGATIARRLATMDPLNVRRFILMGTEIPGHRPPWIELFQKISNPKHTGFTRALLGSRWYRQSSAGFGGCFEDKSLIEGDFKTIFVEPLLRSKVRCEGQIRYLLGIDWKLVDGMATEHARIKMPTLLIWGANDHVFPVHRARVMVKQLPDCRGFVEIPDAKLFVHEEKPAAVARHALQFLLQA